MLASDANYREVAAGAGERAAELGYRIEEFFLEDYPRRESLHRVLLARGVAGLLVWPSSTGMVDFDWSPFAAAALGESLRSPRLSRVMPYHFFNVMLALRELSAAGKERVGLVLSRDFDRHLNRTWSGAFLGWQAGEAPARGRVPVCAFDPGEPGAVARWARRWKPDAVLFHERGVGAALRAAGVEAVDLGLRGGAAKGPGVDPNRRVVGITLVDLVVAQLHRNERGVPRYPKDVLVEGSWVG